MCDVVCHVAQRTGLFMNINRCHAFCDRNKACKSVCAKNNENVYKNVEIKFGIFKVEKRTTPATELTVV